MKTEKMIILTDGESTKPALPTEAVGNTPGDVLKIAIERGSDVDQLERLLNLELRWKAYQAELAYQAAFLAFKQEPELKILKDEIVDFTSKRTGERTKYAYSPLDKAESVLIPLLARHGITHHWRTEPQEGGWVKVTCVLKHVLCHEQADASLLGPPDQTGSKNAHQAIGSNTAYLERYTLCAACGITPKGVDRDARVAYPPEVIEAEEQAQEQPPEDLTPQLTASLKQKFEKKVADAKTKAALLKLWNAMTAEQREGMKASFTARRKALEATEEPVCK